MAAFQSSVQAVFFPSWASRESAIGRSPLRFDGCSFSFSNWVEVGEEARGRLCHKAWIRLHNWPILCWSAEEVKAAISCFGELWEVDSCSTDRTDVSSFRVNIRCQNVGFIPEVLYLMVDDRRFCIPVEIDSWEEAAPILLSEDLDLRLFLDSSEPQERFITSSGFCSVLAAGSPGPRPPAVGTSGGGATRVRHRAAGHAPRFGPSPLFRPRGRAI